MGGLLSRIGFGQAEEEEENGIDGPVIVEETSATSSRSVFTGFKKTTIKPGHFYIQKKNLKRAREEIPTPGPRKPEELDLSKLNADLHLFFNLASVIIDKASEMKQSTIDDDGNMVYSINEEPEFERTEITIEGTYINFAVVVSQLKSYAVGTYANPDCYDERSGKSGPTANRGDFEITVELIHVYHGGSGIGVALFGMMQQIIALTGMRGSLRLSSCYVSSFYITDFQYNWLFYSETEKPDVLLTLPTKPVGHVFPGYLNSDIPGNQIYHDPAYRTIASLTPELEQLRKERTQNVIAANYYPVDLVNFSPIDWVDYRIRALKLGYTALEIMGRLHVSLSGLNEYTSKVRTLIMGENNEMVLKTGLFRDLLRPTRTMDIATANEFEAIVRSMVRTCRMLGNNDVVDAMIDMENNDNPAQTIEDALFNPDPSNIRALVIDHDFLASDIYRPSVIFLKTMLAYLIDYARIMWRPILIHTDIINAFATTGSFDPEYPLGKSIEALKYFTHPSPYFHNYVEVSDYFVFVPQKRPHRVLYKNGKYEHLKHEAPVPVREEDRFITEAVPLLEIPPIFATDDLMRFTKKPRMTLACIHCHDTPAVHTDGAFAFCSLECQSHYYIGL